jgi:hypothetical protein
MVYLQAKNPNLGKFGRVLEWTMLVYFMPIGNMYIADIWYILWPFGNLHSGNKVYLPPFLAYCVKKNLATLVSLVLKSSLSCPEGLAIKYR